jgi:hypothetical protein
MPKSAPAWYRFAGGISAATALAGGLLWARVKQKPPDIPVPLSAVQSIPQNTLSPLAAWPWTAAQRETLPGSVTHWQDRSSSDGTRLELFDFDFGRNPGLRLEIFDQDQDDKMPFDNNALFWQRGVGQITRQLNTRFQAEKRGRVLAAWNGLFFGPNRYGAGATGEHVAPVVLAGKPHYAWGNHRWTFGAKWQRGRVTFKALHLPPKNILSREFDWASGGAQCLILSGQPLKLQPFPRPGDPKLKTPVPSTPAEAGHIPVVDHIKTSRVSLGWSRDNRHFYLLFVQDPDTEASSAIQFRHGQAMRGGWSLADLQRFWRALGVWGAINSDGGDMAQMTYLLPDNRYMLVPPMISGSSACRVVSPQFENAPAGGSLMYFYIRDASGTN